MKRILDFKIFLFLPTLILFTSCNRFIERLKRKGQRVERYEIAALLLAKENRKLKIENGELKFKLQNLEARNDFLVLELEKYTTNKKYKNKKNLKLKSSRSSDNPPGINFKTYNWRPEQLVLMGNQAFSNEDYTKAAEYYNTLLQKYPKYEKINDILLFKSGMSAYKSDKYYTWAINNFSDLIGHYPTSKYYRGAKLWMALTGYKMGNKKLFKDILEEFRKKYRNTPEWKILSNYYEKFKENF